MWIYILLVLFGAAAMIFGIRTAKRTSKKKWHILTAAGATTTLIGLILTVSTLLLLNGIVSDVPEETTPDPGIEEPEDDDITGDDWRTWRGYSADYTITDKWSICFSTLDDSNGYGVYSAAGGARIGSILFDDGEQPAPADNWISVLEDYNGDGANDLGIELADGTLAWFIFDENLVDAWPEPTCGCFPRKITETDPEAYVSHPFEPVNARAALTDEQKTLYDEMYPKIAALEPFSYDTATYGYDTLDDVFAAWSAIALDHLETENYFLIKEVFDTSGMTTSLDAQYLCKWLPSESENLENVRSGIAQFDAAAEEILSGLRDDMTTREKYEYLAYAVSLRTSYDYNSESYASATPWGGIAGGLSICQGYAHSYAYLCEKANLWCQVVGGESKGVAHGWNLIWLPEGTYHVDITWADEQGDPGSTEWMRYFALTQEEIEQDHIITDDTVASGT